jgi:hypothetical protein
MIGSVKDLFVFVVKVFIKKLKACTIIHIMHSLFGKHQGKHPGSSEKII